MIFNARDKLPLFSHCQNKRSNTIQQEFNSEIGYIQKILILLRKHFINDEMHNEYGAYTLIVIYVTITFTTKVVSVH